jgi:hypothetical protein
MTWNNMVIGFHPAATGTPLRGSAMNQSTSTGAIAPNRKAAT